MEPRLIFCNILKFLPPLPTAYTLAVMDVLTVVKGTVLPIAHQSTTFITTSPGNNFSESGLLAKVPLKIEWIIVMLLRASKVWLRPLQHSFLQSI